MLLTSMRLSTSTTAAMPAISRSSLIASVLTIGFFSREKCQCPAGAARVFDKRIFQVQFHDFDPRRRQRLNRRPLPRTKADEDQLPSRPDLPVADQSFARPKRRRLSAKFDDDFSHLALEVLDRTVDPQHAIDQDADTIGHAFHIAENVRAKENRATTTLDDLDHRLEKIAADVGVEAERRIVENEQLRV